MTILRLGYIKNLRLHESSRARYIRVSLYETAEELRAATHRYTGGEAWTETVGCFNPSPFRARYGGKNKPRVDTTSSYAGHIRLAATHLTPEVMIHESTHAALHIYRLEEWAKRDIGTEANLGEGCGDAEEAYAYLHGGLAASLMDMMSAF